jgi:hypothetical protein
VAPKFSARVRALSTAPEADTAAVTVARVTGVVGPAVAAASRPVPREEYATPAPATRSTASTPLTKSVLRFVEDFTSPDSGVRRWDAAKPFLRVC